VRGQFLLKYFKRKEGISMYFTRMSALVLLSVCFAVLPIRAEAVTFTVNSTDDGVDADPGDGLCATLDGVCTLRAAIQEANALATGDTIILKAKKYYLTIPGTGEDAAATGDLDIMDDLKIKGVSSAKTIVNGGALDRVFHIISPVTVKFLNLSIQNGFVQDENGAGIYNWGGTVSLVSCSVANNVSSGSLGLRGGGISSSGVLKIKSSSLINNSVISSTAVAYGGGIAVFDGGTLNISASKIAYNSAASATSAAIGGGIVSLYTNGVTITNSKVLANSAISISGNSVGGGIALHYDSTAALISETNISMNSSTSSGGWALGGGFYFEGETATISSCTINGNRANNESDGLGGGIRATASNITIKKASTIASNLASFDGGGIFNNGSTITVSPNSTVVNNMPNDQN
jgi:CSLREA domain-containing protein